MQGTFDLLDRFSNICLLDRFWDNCQLLHICKQHVSRYACRSTIWIYIHMNTEIYVYKAVVRVVCPKGWVSGVYGVNDFAGRWQYKRIERRDHPVSLHMEVISTAGTESNSTSVISFLLLFLLLCSSLLQLIRWGISSSTVTLLLLFDGEQILFVRTFGRLSNILPDAVAVTHLSDVVVHWMPPSSSHEALVDAELVP